MKDYASTAIRNVAVVGHGGSGKTSLVDALAFVAGSSKRHGRVKDGSALTDYSPDEIEKGYSINLALGFAEWEGCKINLIDTPGYLDFAGDAEAGVFAADASLIVCGATSGVEVGTEKVWDYSQQFHHPVVFFISMMDKEHANFERVYDDIRDHRVGAHRARGRRGGRRTGLERYDRGHLDDLVPAGIREPARDEVRQAAADVHVAPAERVVEAAGDLTLVEGQHGDLLCLRDDR